MASVDLLICAIDHSIGEWEKGYVNSYNEYPPGKSWKGLDRRPGWILITVTDATLADLKPYFVRWKKTYKVEITSDISVQNHMRITVDPDVVSTKGVGNGIEAKVVKNLVISSPFDSSTIDSQPNYLDISVNKQHSLKSVQDHLHDVCDGTVNTRKMAVKSSYVDTVLLNPLGEATLTLTQFANECYSLLDD